MGMKEGSSCQSGNMRLETVVPTSFYDSKKYKLRNVEN